MQSGLWSKKGPVPLIDVSVQARVVEFTAQVTVRQKYLHTNPTPLEATFKFPLDLFGALCGFEVVLDGKTIVAHVKRREEATRLTLEDDMSTDTLSLAGEDDQPDLFICNFGNLEANKEVEFKLTYVTELPSEAEALRFIIPSSTISPNYIFEQDDPHATAVSSPQQNPHKLEIKVDLVMPSNITKIESPTHKITVQDKNDTQATVSYKKSDSRLEPNFVLLVSYANPHTPWGIIEEDEQSKSHAVLLSFFPQLAIQEMNACEIIFLVDCSNSMGGSQLDHVKAALQLFLRALPTGTYFNLIEFGSSFNKLFPKSVEYNEETLQQATTHVKALDADLGGTELYDTLSDIYSSPPINNLARQLFVITDGRVPKTNHVISLVGNNSHNTRVFTFGIGDRVSYHLVRKRTMMMNRMMWNFQLLFTHPVHHHHHLTLIR